MFYVRPKCTPDWPSVKIKTFGPNLLICRIKNRCTIMRIIGSKENSLN